ncbi:hypothetical protein [Pseudogracilibacillus sp. ICA-222130]|uniref:hypothetical protein n=1 Tax=Pseudogracilibacillus sp. ICA-222130 TaxID=3134655 RepID=UPI0030C31428
MMLKRTYIIFAVVSMLFLAACGENKEANSNNEANENNNSNQSSENSAAEEDKNYAEIGETFELIGYYSNEPMDVTVNDISIEKKEDHKEYIEDIYGDFDDVDSIALIDMTVVNKGEADIGYGDFIPKFSEMNAEIDVTYPEHETLEAGDDPFNEVIEPGEEIHFVGSVVLTDPALEYSSVLLFNGYEADEGPFVYAVPQSEHKTPVGTYSLEEEVFPVDHGDDGGLGVTFHDVYTEESVEEMESKGIAGEELTYLAMDVTFENTTDEAISFNFAVPYVRTGDIENIVLDQGLSADLIVPKEGEAFWAYDENMEPGEKLEATIYAGVEKGKEEEAIISYFPYNMAISESTTITIDPN